MIDLHCHVLHEIDDGAQSLTDAIQLCMLANENGVEKIVLTPHLKNVTEIDEFLEVRNEKFQQLQTEIDKRKINIEIFPGAEVYVNDDIFYSTNLDKVTINSSKYILIEFDFFGLTVERICSYLDEIEKSDLIPIIAHPERYEYFQKDYFKINYLLSERDVYFQINAGSLAGFGTREEFELAYQMVKNNVASFIGTDAHSIRGRANDLLRMTYFFPPDIEHRSLDYMVNVAPEAVINNEKLPPIRRGRLQRARWF
ncbi:MAG TPA: CpsB/CapC family capsule biosynthesis tyrosine phosphatase [Clostridia bacterium]|nr:CpsB/CapC family capsule biosynthesis tyrosine phosphatase [Clostridia bacterium]